MKAFIVFALSALVLAPETGLANLAPAPENASSQQVFDVTMSIRNGNRVIAEPRMRVLSGEIARIELEPGDGSHFGMDFTVKPQDAEHLMFAANVDAGEANGNSRTSLQAAPKLIVLAGQSSTIEIGNEAQGIGTYRTDFIIRPVSR